MARTDGVEPTGWALRLVGLLIAVFLLSPLVVIVGMSFNSTNQLVFPPDGVGLHWYRRLLESTVWTSSVATSLRLGIVVSACASVLGYLLALGLERGRFRAKATVHGFVMTPLIAPAVVVGVAMYLVFSSLGLVNSFAGLVLAHVALALPYVVINVLTSLRLVGRDLEKAARSLGANPIQAFLRVTLPLTFPGLLAGAIFAFIVSWDEIVVTIFLSGPSTQTLPITMWSQMKTVVDPTIAAVATGLMAVTVLALCLGSLALAMARRRVQPKG